MMLLSYGVFGFYFCLIAAGAAVAVYSKSLVRAMFGLIVSLLGVAGLYLLLQSPFLAFMQLLIYVGAVSVLVFFALMLTSAHSSGDEAAPAPRRKGVWAVLAGLTPLFVLLPALLLRPVASTSLPATVPLEAIGQVLLEDYVLPFELISIILLVSMAGGVFLAWERRKQ